jgi:hypothetical protein
MTMQAQITDWGQALMASLAGALAMFFGAIPKILGFIVILIAGWIIAALIEKAIVALLRAVNFNGLAERAGFADFVRKSGMNTDASGLIGGIGKWFVRLIALVVAFDALGLPAVSDVLRQLLLWLPNLVVALVALVIGGIAAAALSRVVRGAAAEGGVGNPDLLAKIASVAVWAFAIVVAVNQIGIASALINILFTAIVGAVALALGLAFGLGARDTAGDIVRNWYIRSREKTPQIEESPELAIAQRGEGRGSQGSTRLQ